MGKSQELKDIIKELEYENKKLTCKVSDLKKVNEEQNKLINKYRDILSLSDGNEEELVDFKDRQKRIFDNKVNHGFNTTNIYQEARYILEEVTELMRAVEKNDRENMKEELADIVIFAYGCAEVARLGNLDDEIFKKMTINEGREYHRTSEGDFVKDSK